MTTSRGQNRVSACGILNWRQSSAKNGELWGRKVCRYGRRRSLIWCPKKANRWKTGFMDLYFRIPIFPNGLRRSAILWRRIRIRNLKNWRTTRSTLCVRHSTRMGILTPFILSMIRPSALPTCVTTTNCIVLGI